MDRTFVVRQLSRIGRVAVVALVAANVAAAPALAQSRLTQGGGGPTGGGMRGGGGGISIGGVGLALGVAKAIADGAAAEERRKKRVPVAKPKPERPSKPPTRVVVEEPAKPERPTSKPPRDRGDRKPPVVIVTPPSTPPPRVAVPPARVIPLVPPALVAVPPTTPPPSGGGLPPSVPPTAQPSPLPTTPPVISLPAFEPDEVLITVAATEPETFEAAIAQQFNLTILERTRLNIVDVRLVRLRIPDVRTVPAVVAAVQADPRVALAQPNYLYRMQRDPVTATPASLTTAPAAFQYAAAKLGMLDAHRIAQGRGAKIAVLDSGVDRSHPDFAGAAIEEFDAATGAREKAATDDPHGTGITGIIAGRGGVRGLAPGADVFSARIFAARAGGGIAASTHALIKGLDWSLTQGARVVNMSIAGPRDPLVERAVATFPLRGIIAIAAAGNNGPTAPAVYPAAYPEVIAVTATDEQDRLYEKANRGSHVALAAPGVDVYVPAIGAAHHFQSGTSFAAAHVTGIVALMLELRPNLTPDGVRTALTRAAEDLGTPGPDPEFGAGRIHAAAALRVLSPGPVRVADDK